MKDPAFLFYPNDYLGGTLGMTFEEKGAYIELLMVQFNRGHMTSHMIGQVLGQDEVKIWSTIKDKFKIDNDGNYFNERLELEQNKRKAFADSRRNNLKGENQYTKSKNNKGLMGGHMTSHMENENENENIIKDDNEKYDFDIFWDSYHLISGKPKTDMQAAKKYWIKLTESEKKKALENIKPYCDTINEKRFIKKARTYLSDKNFNDEYVKEIIFTGNLDDYNIPSLVLANVADVDIIERIKNGTFKLKK